jgi:PIN domain nuclease of toxin-antitoxin system
MSLLLDSHSFLWFIEGNPRLSAHARSLMADPANVLFLSIASVWEMAIKVSLGKLQLDQPFDALMPGQITLHSINVLDISLAHTIEVSRLPFHHRDPFDRLIIAQSQVERLPIVGIDGVFDLYGIERYW